MFTGRRVTSSDLHTAGPPEGPKTPLMVKFYKIKITQYCFSINGISLKGKYFLIVAFCSQPNPVASTVILNFKSDFSPIFWMTPDF